MSLFDRVFDLSEGTYEWGATVANPLHDKRVRYGIEAKSQFKAGEQVIVRRRPYPIAGMSVPEVEILTLKGAVLYRDLDTPKTTTMGTQKQAEFLRLFFEHAKLAEPRFGAVIPRQDFDPLATLARLVETGVLSVEQIHEAHEAIDEMASEGDTYDDWRHKHAI